MMKKAITAVLAVIMIFAIQLCAFASYMTYSVRGDGAALVKADTDSKEVGVSDNFFGKKVTVIGVDAFRGNNIIENVTIPESVTSIEWGAFEDCANLRAVVIPEGVTVIEDMTFSGCTELTEAFLPSKLCGIGVRAFAFTKLENVTIPEGTAAIDVAAFEGCKALKTISIPESVIYIGENAFKSCDNVTVECVYGSAAHKYCAANAIAYTIK